MAACIIWIARLWQRTEGWATTREFSSLSSLGYFNKLLPIRVITKTSTSLFLHSPMELPVDNSGRYDFLFGDWQANELKFQNTFLRSSCAMMYFSRSCTTVEYSCTLRQAP